MDFKKKEFLVNAAAALAPFFPQIKSRQFQFLFFFLKKKTSFRLPDMVNKFEYIYIFITHQFLIQKIQYIV